MEAIFFSLTQELFKLIYFDSLLTIGSRTQSYWNYVLMCKFFSDAVVNNLPSIKNKPPEGFPGGAVVGSLPANAGDTGSSPGLGRSHVPRSGWAREPQLLSLRVWSLCPATGGAAMERGPRTAMRSGPRLPQLLDLYFSVIRTQSQGSVSKRMSEI